MLVPYEIYRSHKLWAPYVMLSRLYADFSIPGRLFIHFCLNQLFKIQFTSVLINCFKLKAPLCKATRTVISSEPMATMYQATLQLKPSFRLELEVSDSRTGFLCSKRKGIGLCIRERKIEDQRLDHYKNWCKSLISVCVVVLYFNRSTASGI